MKKKTKALHELVTYLDKPMTEHERDRLDAHFQNEAADRADEKANELDLQRRHIAAGELREQAAGYRAWARRLETRGA